MGGDVTDALVEPPPSRWRLPDPRDVPDEIAGVGADLEPGTLLGAYRAGLFPMRVHAGGPVAWWSPDPRGVLPLDEPPHVSRSLRHSSRRFETSVDLAFEAVMRACADLKRPGGWIDDEFVDAYTALHRLGWAHSVEVWPAGEVGAELVGGIYGVAVGGLFAGESMFHRRTDASKVALVTLVERLRGAGATLFDVQWLTPHLASIGAVEISRDEYLSRLADAIAKPRMRI